jgi:Ser/Thr protein kinase RdoA (MazF antagonist)
MALPPDHGAAKVGRMIRTTGIRIGWHDLPGEVRAAAEGIIGAPVIAAESQPGGFSPGTADRVRTADGRRAFVKAVSPAQNEHSPGMHRQEARVTAALPATAPAPRLLGWHDDSDWVLLVLEDIEGRHPRTPWTRDELERVLAALGEMAAVLTPSPVPDLNRAAASLAHHFAGWYRIAADPPPELDPWVAAHLDELCPLADRGLAALDGQTLVHLDIRADNLLLGPDGRVTVVDWPSACLGPAWLDTLMLLINARLFGDRDSDALLAHHTAHTGAKQEDMTAVLAGLAAFFTDAARLPAPPGLPTLRDFQRVQADAVISWLRERLGRSGD